VCLAIGYFIPAVILACSFLLLVDNFTHTVLHFGIRATEGMQRYAYVLLLAVLIIFSYKLLNDVKRKIIRPVVYSSFVITVSGIILLSIVIGFIAYGSSGRIIFTKKGDGEFIKNRPNILLLSSDGLNASNMSAYGYHRDTTPFLAGLTANALLCENAFSNAGTSGASIASMFTGKLPTQTGLVYPPEILKGEDAYQHLPGILRNHGYTNLDISIRHHADPADLNLRNSFDWANFREIDQYSISERLSSIFGQEPSYLLQRMNDRITGRLLHIFGIRQMEDPLAEVVKIKKRFRRDSDRIRTFFALIRNWPLPFFAHIHLLGTHGPEFFPKKRVFSEKATQDRYWMSDFYDDSILNFDKQVMEIVHGLRKRRMLHKTLIVIFSDHGQRFTVNSRLPLIFLFPNGEHKGRISVNAQNLDIAPTILDFLDIEPPVWMGGTSLISQEINPDRFIITVDPKHVIPESKDERRKMDTRTSTPPFYSIRTVGIIFRHKFYELDVNESLVTISNIEGHTAPCDEADLPDPEWVGQMIINHLTDTGYETSSIRQPLSVQYLDE
jgi:hypothetical protein